MKTRSFAILLLFLFSASFAEIGLPQAQAANEVDIEYCTRSGANMVDYCMGYCELQSGLACTTADYVEEEDTGNIDECICTCGVDQETISYYNVPCGVDLTRPWESGYDDEEYDSFCCLPAMLLLCLPILALRSRP